MDNHESANMLIKTIKIWQFLQYFDELFENDDLNATTIVEGFFKRYDLSLEQIKESGVLPFAQLTTTLSLLLVTFCYARKNIFTKEKAEDPGWDIAGMRAPSYYDLECKRPEHPNMSQVIRTIRNAAAHGFDDDDWLSFPQGKVVSFQTKRGDKVNSIVTFCTEKGFVRFLSDYIQAIQREIVKELL